MTKPGIPKNAYTPLNPGEKYIPYVPAEKQIQEVTARSVLIGVGMAVLFSFSACYLGLVAGQVFEAAIPIAILAVGIANLYRRKSTILENVIIQSIGAASGVVVAGAIFTLPALYILGLKVNLLQTIVGCTLGGFLGILFLIPLRKYFCAEEHGKLPFPEATATTEILATGETGGKSAKVLALSMLFGGVYDFMVEAMNVWPKQLRTDVLLGKAGAALQEKFRWVFKMDSTAALFGLGYIIGLKYASVIAAGSILSFLIFVPMVFFFGQHVPAIVPPSDIPIPRMDELQIFSQYVQKLGIGAIAMAGIIGVIKMGKIILSSFSVGVREISRGSKRRQGDIPRTDLDLSMRNTMLLLLGVFVLIFLAFWGFAGTGSTAGFALKVAAAGILIVSVLAFLFTSVAARATAIVGVNPVSGMTLIALIISSLVLVAIGLTGPVGMMVALIMGCVVCTSLSVSGGFITDLKIGYWLGTTPRNQERYKFLGVVVSAVSVSLAILLIHKAYGFTLNGGILSGGVPNPSIPAPQGNLMAVIIRSLMVQSQIPYFLYASGALIAVLLQMAGVPPLPFALGMYLPIQINMPLFVGGLVSWLLGRRSAGPIGDSNVKHEDSGSSPRERGTLIASGFIAGGALMGVVGAVLNLNEIGKPIRFISVGAKYAAEKVAETGKTIWNIPAQDGFLSYFQNQTGQWIGFTCFIMLCLFCYAYASKKKD